MPLVSQLCGRSRRSRRPPFALVVLLVGFSAFFHVPAAAQISAGPAIGVGPDDLNIAKTKPFEAEPIFASSWLDSALTAEHFDIAHNWKFTWAGEAGSQFVPRDLRIEDYYPWVVNEPVVTAPNGAHIGGDFHGEDRGGAVFVLSYTPVLGTDPTGLRWIQVVNPDYNGSGSIHIDNPFDEAIPFYDPLGASGTFGKGGQWFLDIPSVKEYALGEPTPEPDFYADVQFEVLLAYDNVTAGVHDVTLYGGYRWGYSYTTVDIPETSSAMLMLCGVSFLAVFALTRRYRTRA